MLIWSFHVNEFRVKLTVSKFFNKFRAPGPESQINLGVWLPSEWELERWNSPGLLENCGQLGFQGRWAI
jgi:hypothetical protein